MRPGAGDAFSGGRASWATRETGSALEGGALRFGFGLVRRGRHWAWSARQTPTAREAASRLRKLRGRAEAHVSMI